MKRTTRLKPVKIRMFFRENRRLLLFLLLPLVGFIGGTVGYRALRDGVPNSWWSLLQGRAVNRTTAAVFAAWFSALAEPLLLWGLLFLGGLSVCGVPLSLAVPLFRGFGLGLETALCYAEGSRGLLRALVTVLPHSAMEITVLLMAASEALRMAWHVSGQVLPRVPRGGASSGFRLYCARFILLAGLLAVAAAVDVGLRCLGFNFY